MSHNMNSIRWDVTVSVPCKRETLSKSPCPNQGSTRSKG